MFFTIDMKLARQIFIRERIQAIRFLRDKMSDLGICPDLRTCRDIVDRVQRGQVESFDMGTGSIIVRP